MAQQPQSAFAQDVQRTLIAFSRAARARPLYSPNNQLLTRMMDDLTKAFDALFEGVPEISLKVRPDAFLWEEERVFEEQDVDRSLPFLFFRDGVRRLDLTRGLGLDEIDVLVAAVAQGLTAGNMEDDVVSFLWRHDLQHIRYMTVSASVVDAESDPEAERELETRIEDLLKAIYGPTSDDAGPRSVNIDASDLTAKGIADGLEAISEMAPGFHPARALLAAPSYADRLIRQAEAVDDQSIAIMAVDAAIEAFREQASGEEGSGIAAALLRIFDAAVLKDEVPFAAHIVTQIRSTTGVDKQIDSWLSEAASETRLRQVILSCQTVPTLEASVINLLRTCGQHAVPAILNVLPSFTDPIQRRTFADLAINLGIVDPQPVYEMLSAEQGFVAIEALNILAACNRLDDRELLRQAQTHPRPQMRMELLKLATRMPSDVAQALVIDMLVEDEDPKVRITAARAVTKMPNPRTAQAVQSAILKPDFENETSPVKRALFTAYATLNQAQATGLLHQSMQSADRRLAKKSVEETAIAATLALALVRTPRAIEILKEACVYKNKRVRETAHSLLNQFKREQAP